LSGRELLVASILAGGLTAMTPAAPGLYERFDADKAYRYTAQVAGFGERQPGQPGHQHTENLILSVLKRDGAQVERDDVMVTTPRGRVPVHNIIGKFNVTSNPQQGILMLAGHYDTLVKKGFVGANDGGSSTGILLAFADALAAQPTRLQIWLVWTDVEEGTFEGEDGLYGSRHLAAKLKADGRAVRVQAFFLLDMIGDRALDVNREPQSTSWLQDFMAQAATQLGYSRYFFHYQMAITDDHVSFLNVGVPAVDVVDAHFGRMGVGFDSMGEFHHATTDTMDKVSRASLEIVGRTMLLTVSMLDAR
jgi:Zn-dependent M28 family amino/carboxypeptidase